MYCIRRLLVCFIPFREQQSSLSLQGKLDVKMMLIIINLILIPVYLDEFVIIQANHGGIKGKLPSSFINQDTLTLSQKRSTQESQVPAAAVVEERVEGSDNEEEGEAREHSEENPEEVLNQSDNEDVVDAVSLLYRRRYKIWIFKKYDDSQNSTIQKIRGFKKFEDSKNLTIQKNLTIHKIRRFTKFDDSQNSTIHKIRRFTKFNDSKNLTFHKIRRFSKFDDLLNFTIHKILPFTKFYRSQNFTVHNIFKTWNIILLCSMFVFFI